MITYYNIPYKLKQKSLLHVQLLIRYQISSKCCISSPAINSINRIFDQANPHGLTFFQLDKNRLTQLIIALVIGVQFSIYFTIFHQLNVAGVTIFL